MRRHSLSLLSALLISACSSGTSYTTPEFDVSIELSDLARAKLSTLGESIKVTAFFDGDSIIGANPSNAPFRAVFLGLSEAETNPTLSAHLKPISFNDQQRRLLVLDRYYLLLNVVSGRRAVSSNLLSCSHPELPLEVSQPVLSSPIKVRCSLIDEPAGA